VTIPTKPNPKSILNGKWARFIFVSGRLCIDFTQTGGETDPRAQWERFHKIEDIVDWFAESPLQLQQVQFGPREFGLTLALREAIWRTAEAIRQGEAPLARDVNLINTLASEPDLPPQLTQDVLKQTWNSPATARAALSVIARDAIDLFSGDLRSRIRRCENPKCGLMFVDTSRPGKRRWCLMKRCGNMAKTATYRQQQKAENN
jgi:predicted RNA-binding Zn ribbon-like protein